MRTETIGSPEAAAASVLDALCRVEMMSREYQLELAEWLKSQIDDCTDEEESYAKVLQAFIVLLYDDDKLLDGNSV